MGMFQIMFLGLFGKALKEEGVHGLGFMGFGLVV
jgi:hypothetical protein